VNRAPRHSRDTSSGGQFPPEEALGALRRDTNIRAIESVILDVPTLRRHKLSNSEIVHQSFVHVAVTFDNGVVGHGEAATLGGPRWAEESVEAIKANIDAYLAPALLGQPGCDTAAAGLRMEKAARRNFAAKAALDMALHDALGITLGVPTATLLGGVQRTSFPSIWALASGDAEAEVAEAQAKIAAREFARFKVKIGFDTPARDIARLQRLRAALPEAMIIADLNQAWSEATCIRWFPALAEIGIALVEQPLPAVQMEGMRRLAARSTMPLMLDEGVFTDAEALASGGSAGQVLSLKLVKSGGLDAMRRVGGIATGLGMELYGGCLLESSLGAAAHLAAFATLPALHWGTEQFAPRILVRDTVLEPLRYADFEVHLPTGPGLGVRPDPEARAAFARKA